MFDFNKALSALTYWAKTFKLPPELPPVKEITVREMTQPEINTCKYVLEIINEDPDLNGQTSAGPSWANENEYKCAYLEGSEKPHRPYQVVVFTEAYKGLVGIVFDIFRSG